MTRNVRLVYLSLKVQHQIEGMDIFLPLMYSLAKGLIYQGKTKLSSDIKCFLYPYYYSYHNLQNEDNDR